jgi:hypothetical protein
VLRYDADGREDWRAVGPPIARAPRRIARDGEGNTYVTGLAHVDGEVFDRALTIKYDPDGNEVWQADTPGEPKALVLGGDQVVVGGSRGVDAGSEEVDFLAARFRASDGVPLGESVLPTGPRSFVAFYEGGVEDLAADADGGLVLTGSVHSPQRPLVVRHALTVRLGPDGTLLWTATYAADPQDRWSFPQAVRVDADGNAVVAGVSSVGPVGGRAYFLLKYDPAGRLLWRALYGARSYSRGAALELDGAGRPILAGAASLPAGRTRTSTVFLTARYPAERSARRRRPSPSAACGWARTGRSP